MCDDDAKCVFGVNRIYQHFPDQTQTIQNFFTCYARITLNFKRESERATATAQKFFFLHSFCLKYFWQVCFHLILAVNMAFLHSKMISVFLFFPIWLLPTFLGSFIVEMCVFQHFYITKLRLEAVNFLNGMWYTGTHNARFRRLLFLFFGAFAFFGL